MFGTGTGNSMAAPIRVTSNLVWQDSEFTASSLTCALNEEDLHALVESRNRVMVWLSSIPADPQLHRLSQGHTSAPNASLLHIEDWEQPSLCEALQIPYRPRYFNCCIGGLIQSCKRIMRPSSKPTYDVYVPQRNPSSQENVASSETSA